MDEWKVLLCFLCVSTCLATNPWFKKFTPITTYYVSETATIGEGDGSQSDPYSFYDVIKPNFASPGDLYWLSEGTYASPDSTNTFYVKTRGTEENPIVFRAIDGDRVTFT